MTLDERVPLTSLTTLKVGGEARYVLDAVSLDDIPAALAQARARALPFVVLGQGSNVLPSDGGYNGVIIRPRLPGIAYEEQGDETLMRVGAGVSWDDLVRDVALRGLWGIENLAGIPGTVGAAPVQNIGAYGAELMRIVQGVDVYDAATNAPYTLTREECGFAYRDSRFKHEPNLIITSVSFALSQTPTPHLDYADLASARDAGADVGSPGAIGEVVRAIRARKFPDLAQFGTAGSFFKNPLLSQAQFAELSGRYGAIPSFPQGSGVKVPLAFILDRVLGLRGYRRGPTFLFGNQPLVLVADQGATAHDIDALASEIETRVKEATGISIEREVRMLDAHQSK